MILHSTHFLLLVSVQIAGVAVSLMQFVMQFLVPVSIKLLIPHYLPKKIINLN